MKWTWEAEDAVKKVPFFVRKKVKQRVEQETREAGKTTVSLADVKTAQARFLTKMSSEVNGYQIDICFGPGGCPNRANPGDRLLERIEGLLKKANLLHFLKKSVKGDLKFHHEFRVTIADCPNACSQPQIKDIGIIGAAVPKRTDEPCSACAACVDICPETAVRLDGDQVEIDMTRCLFCGKCATACPTSTITTAKKGFRVQLGGKLGRHPQLAMELPRVYSEDEVVDIVQTCIRLYKENSVNGERFGAVLQRLLSDPPKNIPGFIDSLL